MSHHYEPNHRQIESFNRAQASYDRMYEDFELEDRREQWQREDERKITEQEEQ